MTLTNKAYLEVEDDGGVGVFEFETDLEFQGSLEKSYIMASRGQYVREIVNQTPLTGNIGNAADRRAGFYIDGGAGTWSDQLSFSVHKGEDVDWGDGSGGRDAANVTARDASGTGISAFTRKHIFELWMARTITASNNPARLYTGEYTTGKYASSAGAFNQAMPVAVIGYDTQTSVDEPGVLSGSITFEHMTVFSDLSAPSWLEDSVIGTFSENAAENLGVIPDE